MKKTIVVSCLLLVAAGGCSEDANDDLALIGLLAVAAAQCRDTPTVAQSSQSLPTGIVMQAIPGASFTMGNNGLLGPAAGQAAEHTVTLSSFTMSATEVTNAQYVEFLNRALGEGLIEVATGTVGPDRGKRVVRGTAASAYNGKVLYSLDGTRVMKDHDNADGDGNAFTGVIEPENPLNIAYIGYNSGTGQFYIKDPHSVADFHWQNLCNYYDYTSVPNQLDSVLKNDFATWSASGKELENWTSGNPAAATNLPNKATISSYPVTFVRWWGAQAFALYYGVALPSEAQWEFAAKGGSNFVYAVYDGTSVNDANWNTTSANPATHHVRAAQSGNANPYGLYNLGGNVWEWIWDNYAAYSTSSVTDPVVLDCSTTRSWRGGSWNYHQATLETSGRFSDREEVGNDHFGFRIVK